MSPRLRKAVLFTFALGVLLTILGLFTLPRLIPSTELRTKTMAVNLRSPSKGHEASPARRVAPVQANIRMQGGMLELSGGAQDLLIADLTYNAALPEPVLDLEESSGRATLNIEQPKAQGLPPGHSGDHWKLQFNDQVALDLSLTLGGGWQNLNLNGLNLNSLEIKTGDSNLTLVDLTGYWPQDVQVSIKLDQGKLTLRLPQGAGVRMRGEDLFSLSAPKGLRRENGTYINNAFGKAPATLDIDLQAGRSRVEIEQGLPGDMPVKVALQAARMMFSKEGAFSCQSRIDDREYLVSDSVKDLWYDYLCEYGPNQRSFDGSAQLTQELAQSELVDQIRREFYRDEKPLVDQTMKFNLPEFFTATKDMLKVIEQRKNFDFSITHFMGSFNYSVWRAGDRLHFKIENQTDRSSGTHIPTRFADNGYHLSLETLVTENPDLEEAFLLELLQSGKYPVISLLQAKSRQDTQGSTGGGDFHQTFEWSESYLPHGSQLPNWPSYLDEIDVQ
jgi:hypothetical protein